MASHGKEQNGTEGGTHASALGIASGPGNRAIATTLLEFLAVGGRAAAGARATRALGLGEGGLAEAPAWLAADAVARMFAAADVEPALARAVGHRLTTPDATGFRLYGLGLATPEKAYRRIQALLPREDARARWDIEEISEGCARLQFVVDNSDEHAGEGRMDRVEQSRCALRKGQLEAIPGLFGLLPARVEESACRSEGAAACRYEVVWKRAARRGVFVGAVAGVVIAGAFGAATVWLGASWLLALAVALVGFGAALAIGRSLDLSAQLEAVAGARRGHLALFDQVDDALASKLDALARVDARLDANEADPRRSLLTGTATDHEPEDLARPEILSAAHEIHSAAGDLECWFEAEAGRISDATNRSPRVEDVSPRKKRRKGKRKRKKKAELEPVTQPGPESDGGMGIERGRVRDIREWAARIVDYTEGGDGSTAPRRSVDLASLVARAVVTARPALGPKCRIEVDVEAGLRPVRCDPVQIERVIVQLLRNAVEASLGLTEAPRVDVTLRNAPRGVELAVEDRGVGIESSAIDEVFDPFFGGSTGSAGGLGLPVCLQIVEQHGGELRIENEERAGTRISVLLPGESGAGDPSLDPHGQNGQKEEQ